MSTNARAQQPTQRRPLAALAKAEFLQFRRNTTLLVMGIAFPVVIPLVTFFITKNNAGVSNALTATAFEMFALMAMLLVQYYSVLSMVTTRRSAGVLKRLRTGESKDWQIQVAPMVPGAMLIFISTVLVSAIIFGSGSPAPVNPVLIGIAMVAGMAIFSLLALATSAVTKNAEAAQITSLPIIALAMAGLASLRSSFPDRIADIAGLTPFAALSDLIHLGASGQVANAPASVDVLDFWGTFSEIGVPVAILAVWTFLALELTRRNFRWDDRG